LQTKLNNEITQNIDPENGTLETVIMLVAALLGVSLSGCYRHIHHCYGGGNYKKDSCICAKNCFQN
jgi:hypothetical protein